MPRGLKSDSTISGEGDTRLHIAFALTSALEFTLYCSSSCSEEQAQSILTTFQLIPGARFDWNTQPPQWMFPVSFHDQLHAILEKTHGVVVHPLPSMILSVAREKCRQVHDAGGAEAHRSPKLEEQIPEYLLMQLAPFQKQGVEFILRNEGRALLADDMGLGKTRTSVAAAVAYMHDWPVLVVCPSSARHNWNAELSSLLVPVCLSKNDVRIVESASQDLTRRGAPYKFLIISYNLIQKMEARINQLSCGVIICDECHYLKNSRANRTKVLVPMLKRAKRAILISGTPALSRPMELFTQLNALNQKAWYDEKEFGKRYCRSDTGTALADGEGLTDDGGATGSSGSSANAVVNSTASTEYKGASNTQELHVMLTSTLMIRRLKRDILQSLPSKQREVVRVPVQDEGRRLELRKLLANFRANSSTKESGVFSPKKSKKTRCDTINENSAGASGNSEGEQERMSLLLQLFTQSGEAKLPSVLQHIKKHLDDPHSGKILVFAHHRVVLDTIENFVRHLNVSLIRIDGQTSGKDRHESTRHFQSEPQCRVALLAITAAGISITLTAASTVFFAEMFWTPGSIIQAEDRAHRIGQHNTVHVKYFLADDTVDDVLWPLLKKKVRTLGEVVEGGFDSEFMDIEGDSTFKSSSQPPQKGSKKRWGTSNGAIESHISREIYDLTKGLGEQELKTALTLAAEEDGEDPEEQVVVLDEDEEDLAADHLQLAESVTRREADICAKLYMSQQNKKLSEQTTRGTDSNSFRAPTVVELLDSDSDADATVEVSNAEDIARKICERLVREGKMDESVLF